MPDRSASTVTILLLLAACSHESLEVVPARIDVSPASLDFGMQEVGVPTTAILEVTNDSPATLEVAGIAVAQTGSVFSVSPVELRVERRSAASVTVTFTPAGVADYSSELVIDSNAEDRPVLHIPLAGTGTRLCGDGEVHGAEACDDGAANSDTAPNACRSDCSLPVCGDGVVDTDYGEACDDGNDVDTDDCHNNCRTPCIPDTVCRAATGVCDLPELCGSDGQCPSDEFVEAGGDGTGDGCPVCENCDGSGACVAVAADQPDFGCDAPATECRSAQACDGAGQCVVEYADSGAICGDQSTTECSSPDTCDGAGTCLGNHVNAGESCGAGCGECNDSGACAAAGGDHRVPEDYSTIGDAILAAMDGDRVCVAAGEYNEDVFINSKNIALVGLGGSAGTILNGTGDTSTLRLDNSTSEVVGFTICGGAGYQGEGGGLHIQYGASVFRDLVITDNHIVSFGPQTADGGGVFAYSTTSSFENVMVASNSATSDHYARGGGVTLFLGAPSLRNVVVVDNEAVHTVGPASYAGGIDLYGTATIVMNLHNVVVAGNRAYLGGGVLTNQGGSHVLENVTIAGNTADYAAGMYIESSMTPILNNVIIANNAATIDGGGVRAIDASFSLTYTTFFNNAPQDFVGTWNPIGVDGNISDDPLFADTSSADPTQWDLTLQDGSPSIDTGDVDIFDPDSSRSNMGAYGGPGSADW